MSRPEIAHLPEQKPSGLVVAPITSTADAFRPARGLLGWLEPDAAHQLLVAGHAEATVDADVVSRATAARQAASSRSPADQADVVSSWPTGIGDHLAQLRQIAKILFDEGWRPCSVDMARLYSLQPTTFADHVKEGVDVVDPDEKAELAGITLPLMTDVQMDVSFNAPQRVWTVSSRNLNLQVLAPVEPTDVAPCAFGFSVAPSNSLFQVAHFEDRYFCRDGHHRAYQLLRRGIRTVPALVRSFSSYSELAPKGNLFPEAILLGKSPPTLHDFLDDRVAADVLLPRTRKVVVVSAEEVEIPV